MRKFLMAAAAAALTTPAFADGHGAGLATTYDFDGSFDDATFAVESAIVGAGLVIDYVSHTGEMLNRNRGGCRLGREDLRGRRHLPVLLGRLEPQGDGSQPDEPGPFAPMASSSPSARARS